MSLDDDAPGSHRREVAQAQARGHVPPPSTRRDPYVDPEVRADRYIEELTADLAALEDQAAGIRRTLAQVQSWVDRYDPDDRAPAVDPRMFDTGTDDQPRRAS